MLGAKVPRKMAEVFRKEMASAGLLDKSHAIVEDSVHVLIPLVSMPTLRSLDRCSAEVLEYDFPARSSNVDPIDEIRRIAAIPASLKHLLPGKWEKLRDVGIIRLDAQLDDYETEAASAYASVLGLKTVLRDLGGIAGEYREPVTRLILGKDTVTTHLENGIRFRFDAAKIMFSSGNMDERLRMSSVDCTDETVVDMFAGIGYFTLPLAVYQNPRKIIACELNPVAHSYLLENIRLNRVEKKVEPVLGDNRDLPGTDFADRVVMGYVKTTHEFLPTAIRLLRSGGTVHYHETCPNELLPNRPLQRLLESVKGGRVEVVSYKKVKSYAPGVSHVVVDARVFKPV